MTTAFSHYLKENNYEKFDLKAVLFDMDGVLYDSMKHHSRSWYETATEFGLQSTPEEFYMHEGRVGTSTIDILIERNKNRAATEEEKQAIYKRKTELFARYNNQETIPYAYDMLKLVVSYGLQPVLVTGSGQKTLLNNLERDFPGIFRSDMMVTAYDVKNGKPNPEPYLTGLRKAGNLKPNQVVIVENAPMGVESGKAAGVFTIAVNTGPLDEKVLWDAGANLVLPSMQDLVESWDSFADSLGLKK